MVVILIGGEPKCYSGVNVHPVKVIDLGDMAPHPGWQLTGGENARAWKIKLSFVPRSFLWPNN